MNDSLKMSLNKIHPEIPLVSLLCPVIPLWHLDLFIERAKTDKLTGNAVSKM